MKKTKFISSVLVLISLLISNCSQEKMQIFPADFDVIVDEFFLQANLRGLDIQLEDYDFTIRFDKIEEPNIVGHCRYRDNRILIDSVFWNSSDYEKREWLVFHELGHCLLNRKKHRNKKTEETCISYMRGAKEDIKCSFNFYSKYWRTYYLDELFDNQTTLPDWYLDNQNYNFASTETLFEMKDSLIERIEINDIDFDKLEHFLVEFNFENFDSDVNSVRFNLGDIKLKSCDKCQVGKIEITHSDLSKQFYQNDDLQFNSDIKLSMIRNGDIISFFVNESFVHAMEYELVN